MPNVNPQQVLPRRNLPGEAENWGRQLEDMVFNIAKAVVSLEQSGRGTNRNLASTTSNLADQLIQLRSNYPVAAIISFAGSDEPSGWFICDGRAVSRAEYSDLYAVIGTTYGAGDGSTTFNVPNLEGRVIVGQDPDDSQFNGLGETGGAKTHTLTTSEMPNHTHTQNSHSHAKPSGTGGTVSYGPFGDFLPDAAASVATSQGLAASNTGSTTATNQSTGGGGAHNNLQPYMALPYIIKWYPG